MKREEIAQRLVFKPFKIVIETEKERNILASLAARTSGVTMQEVANAWGIGFSDVQFTLNKLGNLLQRIE